jgi:hypothetical protein
MTFEAKFRKKNKKIAKSSVVTYLANIRRITKALGHKEIPEGPAWLKKAPQWLRKQKLNTKKLLSAASVKAAQAYGEEHKVLSKIMTDSTEQYDKERLKQKKTKREKVLMPGEGYEAVRKAAAKLVAQLPAKVGSMRDYMQLQDAWLLSFYSRHTPRLISDVAIGKGVNRIQKKGATWVLTLGKHKTSKSSGKSVIRLDKSLTKLTGRLVNERPVSIKHNMLLSAARGGTMSKSALSQRLTKLSAKTLGRGFSTQIMRVLKATSQSAKMKAVREYLAEMGHGIQEERKYVAK